MWSWWIDGSVHRGPDATREIRPALHGPSEDAQCAVGWKIRRWWSVVSFWNLPILPWKWVTNGGIMEENGWTWMRIDELCKTFYYLRYMKSHWPSLIVDLRLIFSASGPPTWEHDHRRIDAFCRCQVEDGKPRCRCFGLTSFGPFNFVIWMENDTHLDGERRDGWDMRQRGGMGWMDHNGSRRIKRSIEDTESMPPWTVRKADEKRVEGWPFLQTCQCLCAMTSVTIWTYLDILCYTVTRYFDMFCMILSPSNHSNHKAMRKWLEPRCRFVIQICDRCGWAFLRFLAKGEVLKEGCWGSGSTESTVRSSVFLLLKDFGDAFFLGNFREISADFLLSAFKEKCSLWRGATPRHVQTFVVTSPNVNVRCSERI